MRGIGAVERFWRYGVDWYTPGWTGERMGQEHNSLVRLLEATDQDLAK